MSSFVRSTFLQRFSYRPYLSVDARGIEEWGELVTDVPCRAQPSQKMINDSSGAQVVEELVLFTEAAVTVKDLVWLPGVTPPEDAEDTSGSRRPLAVATRTLLLSPAVDHYEVHL